jgi:hypothetical protein
VRAKMFVDGRLNADMVGQSAYGLGKLFGVNVAKRYKVMGCQGGGWRCCGAPACLPCALAPEASLPMRPQPRRWSPSRAHAAPRTLSAHASALPRPQPSRHPPPPTAHCPNQGAHRRGGQDRRRRAPLPREAPARGRGACGRASPRHRGWGCGGRGRSLAAAGCTGSGAHTRAAAGRAPRRSPLASHLPDRPPLPLSPPLAPLQEKLSPLLAMYRAPDFKTAVDVGAAPMGGRAGVALGAPGVGLAQGGGGRAQAARRDCRRRCGCGPRGRLLGEAKRERRRVVAAKHHCLLPLASSRGPLAVGWPSLSEARGLGGCVQGRDACAACCTLLHAAAALGVLGCRPREKGRGRAPGPTA